jgi:hypothetical protein
MGHAPLDEQHRDRIAQLIDRYGEVGAAARLHVARTTLLRALAGRPLLRGSALLLRTALAKVA